MITTVVSRVDYIANGTQTTFPYPFKVFAASDLKVYLDGVAKTLNTDYTVTGVGSDSGGNVVFTAAPASGVKVTILRDVPPDQQTDYVENDKFPATSHEDALDKLTMLIQTLRERLGRVPALPVQSSLVDIILQEPGAGKYLRWQQNGQGIEGVEIIDSSNIGVDTVTVPGGATSVTIPVAAVDNLYHVVVTPSWNTTCWIVSKTASQFVVEFGTAAPSQGGSLYWRADK